MCWYSDPHVQERLQVHTWDKIIATIYSSLLLAERAQRVKTHSGHDNRDLRYIFIYKYVKFDHKCACAVIL